MLRAPWPALLLGLWIGALSACAPAGEPVPPGPALAKPKTFELALYYTGPPREDPQAALDDLLAGPFTGWTGMLAALRLLSALAWRTGGLVWDEETREVFTPSYWDEFRIENWPEGGIPGLRHHMTIHIYRKDNGYRRAVSLGLGKFGLPDLVVENLSGSSANTIGKTISLVAQALAEGGKVGDRGEFDLDIRSLGPSGIREDNLASLAGNATAKARLRLVHADLQDGDADNALVEILADRYEGADLPAKQDRMLAGLFGSEADTLHPTAHGEEILAASQRAREKLTTTLKPAFLAGFAPGEILLVKAPFESAKGKEWMWVEYLNAEG